MQRRRRRKRACAHHQDIRPKGVENFAWRTVIGCVERENFGAGHVIGQLPQRAFLTRHRQHAGTVADGGLHDPPSNAAAAADDDHVFACQ